MSSQTGKRLLVVGLDGATFDVLDPYVRKGQLPALGSVAREGVKGPLASTIPPVTGPSWATFMTGKEPGKHGIFDFVRPAASEMKRIPVNYHHIRAKTIWRMVAEAGKKVCVVNMPLTYPPPSDGVFITGLLTPGTAEQVTNPPALLEEITEKFGPYIFDVWWQSYGRGGAERFLDDLMRCTEQRIRVIDHLMDSREWDLFTAVFIGTDRIQHYLWRYIHLDDSAKASKLDQRLSSKILEYYSLVDRWLQKTKDRLGDSANILIVSDHGFGPLDGKFYVNRWLQERGYLEVHETSRRSHRLRRELILGLRRLLHRLDPFGLRRVLPLRLRGGRMAAYDFLQAVDWTKTIAYACSNTEQGIYINLQGREPFGSVEPARYEEVRQKIMAALRELRDPFSGDPLVSQIYRREELYQGPHVGQAPDVVFFLREGLYLADVQLKDRLFEKASWTTGWGTHRQDGILLGIGPDLRKGEKLVGAKIADIAPTILRLLDVPIPQDLDGTALLQALEPAYLEAVPERMSDEQTDLEPFAEADAVLSSREQADVEERLKGLGYM